jgi:hypothetical protein
VRLPERAKKDKPGTNAGMNARTAAMSRRAAGGSEVSGAKTSRQKISFMPN